jgi:plasmid replication initiation protein
MGDVQFSLPLLIYSPLVGKIKNDRTMMVWNFFALTKDRVTELPVYDDGRVRIEINGTKNGVATIWDKELLIYIGSLMQDKLNRGETVGRRFTFTAHDFCRVIGIKPSGTAYNRIHEGLGRLQGTQIRTNIETGGTGEDRAFSWVTDYNVEYRRLKSGEKEMKSVTLELCDWLYRAILKDGRMLTYHPAYFRLSPLERRLYEIARAHCGNQAAFKINIEKLRLRVGSETPLKQFKAKMVVLSKQEKVLPDYGLAVIDPRRPFGLIDPMAPPMTGRTPLKAWMVFFYRRDKLAGATPFSQAPEVSDNDE